MNSNKDFGSPSSAAMDDDRRFHESALRETLSDIAARKRDDSTDHGDSLAERKRRLQRKALTQSYSAHPRLFDSQSAPSSSTFLQEY